MSYGANDPNGLPLGLPSILSLGLPPLVNPYPALNLDFINNQTLDSRVTFSRGSQATLFDSTGTLIFAPSNVIRNNTMQGAVAGTPGTLPTNWFSSLQSGIAANVIGTGTENGITYIDVQIVGTSGATGNSGVSFESTTGVIAASGQTWAASTYAKIVGGSLTNVNSVRLTIAERTSGGSFLADTQTAIVVGTNALSTQRYETSRTLNQATTARVTSSIVCNVTSGNAIDITLRIGLPQLEQGAFATSVIPTTTTALTRNADVASMTGTNFSSWYSASEGTLFAEYSRIANVTGRIAGFDDGTFSDQIRINANASTNIRPDWQIIDNASTEANVLGAVQIAPGAVGRTAGVYKQNDFQQATNGTLGIADTSGNVPTVTAFRIGTNELGASNINGYIRRLAFYPQRLPNTTLQALTS
jgi:hypothetical protein